MAPCTPAPRNPRTLAALLGIAAAACSGHAIEGDAGTSDTATGHADDASASASASGGSTGASDSGAGTTAATSASSATADTGDDGNGSSTTGDAPGQGWTLVWSDEFDGEAIDDAKWGREVNCWGGGNGEQQCYTASDDNAYVEGGRLHIVARNQPTSGPAVNDDDPSYNPGDTSVTLPYSSARLRTRGLGDWRFGRIEIRAQLPRGQGTWTGVWMLPTDQVYGGWAASGEIDIMEAVNLGVGGETRVYGTLHYGSYWPNNVHSGTEYALPGGVNPADDFHDYALEWEQGEIRWYVDGFHYATAQQWYTRYDDGSGQMVLGEGAAPFDERFHLLLNLAVGGAWAGNVNDGGIDASVFPQQLVVDHVRVYACGVDPETGDGCDTLGDDAELVPGVPPP